MTQPILTPLLQVPVGKRVTLRAKFRNAGVLFDPSEVDIEVKQGGTIVLATSYPAGSLTRESVGVYSYSFLVTTIIGYKVRYSSPDDGVGSKAAAFEGMGDGF